MALVHPSHDCFLVLAASVAASGGAGAGTIPAAVADAPAAGDAAPATENPVQENAE